MKEADKLMNEADNNEDGQLTYVEILVNESAFTASGVTGYGHALKFVCGDNHETSDSAEDSEQTDESEQDGEDEQDDEVDQEGEAEEEGETEQNDDHTKPTIKRTEEKQRDVIQKVEL